MNYEFNKLLKIDPLIQLQGGGISKSNSSEGSWVVDYSGKYSTGLKFNGFEFFFNKKEAQKFLVYLFDLANNQENKLIRTQMGL